MSNTDRSDPLALNLLARFPESYKEEESLDLQNPAIELFGRRFYKDQEPLEYLHEFLLVFSSPKDADGGGAHEFRLSSDEPPHPSYYPKARVPLKLFAFFPLSKLETRHDVHRRHYLKAVEQINAAFSGLSATDYKKEEAVRLLQSLLSGFVGIGKNRTWVTFSFLPFATALLSREVTWQHPDALKEKKGAIKTWDDARNYFDQKTRNFFGRGGELIFLQLINLFAEPDAPELLTLVEQEGYGHLKEKPVVELKRRLENSLREILEDAVSQLDGIVRLIESLLAEYGIERDEKGSQFAWVPKSTRIEAYLFAFEMENICGSTLSSLEKVDLLHTLISFQVMRSLCFQSRRVDTQFGKTFGFAGDYVWIVCAFEEEKASGARKMAESSCAAIEGMIYRAVRSPLLRSRTLSRAKNALQNADDNGFKHFRKFGKQLGFIVPIKGPGQRFVLHPGLLRFLVAALVKPGEYLRLTEFYKRVFAHYGIALGGEPLATAVAWLSGNASEKSYGLDVSTAWVEEALQQGGFLIELSDAVSIVHNPGPEDRHV